MTLDEAKREWEIEQANWSPERKEWLAKQPRMLDFARSNFFEKRGFKPGEY